ncbi:PIN domain-containing protein [Caldilinea sp.]|uniref:PIN domain-containing protein n=1 Tax=Caldilinea sp. TaxID=2293560 RepID=UPI0030D983BB
MALSLLLDTTQGCTSFVGRTSQTGVLRTFTIGADTQTLGELFRVLTGKAKRPAEQTREAVLSWADSFAVVDSTWGAFQSALALIVDHQLPIWDALILAVAAENRCRLLLSEDFHDGFTWRGVTVANPFVASRSPLLSRLLRITK